LTAKGKSDILLYRKVEARTLSVANRTWQDGWWFVKGTSAEGEDCLHMILLGIW